MVVTAGPGTGAVEWRAAVSSHRPDCISDIGRAEARPSGVAGPKAVPDGALEVRALLAASRNSLLKGALSLLMR